jgi:Lectin C-type domain
MTAKGGGGVKEDHISKNKELRSQFFFLSSRRFPMKFVFTAAALGAASMTMLLASFSFVAVAAAEHAHLPRRNKACNNMKNMVAKACATTTKPTKKPTTAVKIPAKPTKKPSKRPTRFPTPAPSSAPSFTPTSRPSDSPTASPSRSPTSSPTAGCANLRVPVHSHSGHIYAIVVHASLTWDQANDAAGSLTCCGAEGRLVVVDDAPERDFILAKFNVPGQYGWFGLNDAEQEGTYIWTDGTTLNTSLFAPVPLQGDADSEDCGLFLNNPSPTSPSKWYTYSCTAGSIYSLVEFDCSAAL